MLLSAACGPPVVELRLGFPSVAALTAVNAIEVATFSEVDGPAVSCSAVDPRGRPARSIEARSGRAASAIAKGPLAEEIVPDLPTAGPRVTVAVEATGPSCRVTDQIGAERRCTAFRDEGRSVLRAWGCLELDLSDRPSGPLDLSLEVLAEIGAELRIPPEASLRPGFYQAENGDTLLLASGELGGDGFVVQALDALSGPLLGVQVSYSVVEGPGTIIEEQPVLTRDDPKGRALARASVRAGWGVQSSTPLRVEAHVPGFEGSPVSFNAQVLPPATGVVLRVPTPAPVALADVDEDAVPLILRDLDGDGRLEVLTGVGRHDHRLVILSRALGAAPEVALGPAQPLQLRALEVAELTPGRRTVVAAVQARIGRVEGGRLVSDRPGLELWEDLDRPGLSAADFKPPLRLEQEDRAPMIKGAIAIESVDFDGDGIDELLTSRCSWSEGGGGVPHRCVGGVEQDGDSSIDVLRVDARADVALVASIPQFGGSGGFREVHAGALNDDRTPDLYFVANNTIGAVEADRLAPGFGFGRNPRWEINPLYGASHSFALGTFDAAPGLDVALAGPKRESGDTSGLVIVTFAGATIPDSQPSIDTGLDTFGNRVQVRTASLNGDEWSDVLFLDRDRGVLSIFYGGGQGRLAAGPSYTLPTRHLGSMDAGNEPGDPTRAVVAISLLDLDEFWILELEPDR